MKQLYFKNLFIALLLLYTTNANAYDFMVDSIYYNIIDSTAKTVEVTFHRKYGDALAVIDYPYSGDVKIPESVVYEGNTYKVTKIGYSAFSNDKLTSITIPASIKTIGYRAFCECSVIDIYIDDLRAWLNTNIYEENIEGEVYSSPFWGGANLHLKNGRGYQLVTDLIIPDGVKRIPAGAFAGSKIKSITIPPTLTNIGLYAFKNCKNLSAVYITDISAWCQIDFEGYNRAWHGQPNYSNPLQNAGNLYLNGILQTDITIPYGITEISKAAFYNCKNIRRITIPSSVKTIERSAFKYCSNLTDIEIPSSVTSIKDDAFNYCNNLKRVHIEDLSAWCNIDIGKYGYINGDMVTDGSGNPLKYADELLLHGKPMKDIVIPDDITEIKDYAFYGYSGIASVTIGDNVTRIGDRAFLGCAGLKDIYALSAKPAAITSGTFSNYSATLHVPFGAKASYEEDTYWNNFTHIVESFYKDFVLTIVSEEEATVVVTGYTGSMPTVTIPAYCTVEDRTYTVTGIGESAFSGCTGIKSIEIPNSIASIGADAFDGCTGLTAVNINNINNWCGIAFGNEYSNPLAFAGNLYLNGEKVVKLVIPENVTSISGYAFRACTSLESLVIGEQVTNIGYEAFCRCYSLKELEIHGTPYLEQAAFSRTGMEEIILPEGITNIGNWGFDSSPNLKRFVIPSTIKSMGECVFQCCDSLESITSRIAAEDLFEARAAFYDMDAPNCILYVPKGAKEKYETTPGWRGSFAEIREYDDTNDIDKIKQEDEGSGIAYDLQGKRIYYPAKGIYIIDGKKKLIK